MSEPTIAEAALARADRNDWQGRARREAAAILDDSGYATMTSAARDTLVSLLAIAWLQGVNLGSHETLANAEAAFARLREAL